MALASLLGCGALIGLSTNLAKVAHDQNILPLPFLAWSLAGATLILCLISLLKRQSVPTSMQAIKYYFIAAFYSVVASNLIFFSAVPHVGVSFVALTISLPPLLTYVAALTLGMEAFSKWRAIGVLFALVGTAVLVSSSWSLMQSDHTWILITLLGPIFLAAGNIYRTRNWPTGAKAESLAPGMLLAATLVLLILGIIVPSWTLSIQAEVKVYALILLQSTVFAGQFLLLFVLQKAGGPVLLSLIGAVGAVFGIPFAMFLLDEPLLPALLPSALLIGSGMLCMVKAQFIGVKK